MIKTILFVLLSVAAISCIHDHNNEDDVVFDLTPFIQGKEFPSSFPEEDVKILPTKIDIQKLREAYATESKGERFLPGGFNRLPLEFFGERRRF